MQNKNTKNNLIYSFSEINNITQFFTKKNNEIVYLTYYLDLHSFTITR